MKLNYLVHVTGYEWAPNSRKIKIHGILYKCPKLPCSPEKLLVYSDIGSCSLGQSILIPTNKEEGLRVPITGCRTSSNSVIADIDLLRASEDVIGYEQLGPIKGKLLPIFYDMFFNFSTYEEHIKHSEPYQRELDARTHSPTMPLNIFWSSASETSPINSSGLSKQIE